MITVLVLVLYWYCIGIECCYQCILLPLYIVTNECSSINIVILIPPLPPPPPPPAAAKVVVVQAAEAAVQVN